MRPRRSRMCGRCRSTVTPFGTESAPSPTVTASSKSRGSTRENTPSGRRPIYRQGANSGLVTYGEAPTDLDETLLARLVRVRAGRRTEDVGIPHAPRPNPPATSGTGAGSGGPGIRAPNLDYEHLGQPLYGHPDSSRTPVPLRAGQGGSPGRTGRAAPTAGSGVDWTIEWSSEAGAAVFDWMGPYRDWWWDYEEDEPKYYVQAGEGDTVGANLGATSPTMDISISDYRIERVGSVVRHSIEMAWPEGVAASLRFRSENGACDAEPMVVCDVGGCELQP